MNKNANSADVARLTKKSWKVFTHIHISLNVIFSNDYSVNNCNDNDNNGHVYITQDTIMTYNSERLSSSGLIGDDGKFTAPIAGAYEFKIYSRTVSNRDISYLNRNFFLFRYQILESYFFCH